MSPNGKICTWIHVTTQNAMFSSYKDGIFSHHLFSACHYQPVVPPLPMFMFWYFLLFWTRLTDTPGNVIFPISHSLLLSSRQLIHRFYCPTIVQNTFDNCSPIFFRALLTQIYNAILHMISLAISLLLNISLLTSLCLWAAWRIALPYLVVLLFYVYCY